MDPPADGPRNMALDHALALELAPGEGVLRLYAWSPPTISFGRNEPVQGCYDLDAARRQGIAFVRRPTGGRAVLHDGELTYAVVVPDRALGGPRAAYRTVNRGIVEGLRALGVPVTLVEGAPVPALDAGPCFAAPAPGEVVAGGRKLVGSAQARIGGRLLQHGSVLVRGDQGRLARLAGSRELPASTATLETWAGPVPWERLTGALIRGFKLALRGSWTEGEYLPQELERAEQLRDRYASSSWTWRR